VSGTQAQKRYNRTDKGRATKSRQNKKWRKTDKGIIAHRLGRTWIRRRAANRARIKIVVDALKARPCMDCGGAFDPVCMDFDHRDGEIKVGNISKMVSRANIDDIKTEIAKCDLVCANCHRLRTFKKRNHRTSTARGAAKALQTERQLELPVGNP